jgi:Tfp pilus assembly protein PilF
VLLLLIALAQGPSAPPDRHLPAYLAILSAYAGGERLAALRELRAFGLVQIDEAISALTHRGAALRAVPQLETDIDFRLVEAAIVMHAEEGLLQLQASAIQFAGWHLAKSVGLFEASRVAARSLQTQAAIRRKRGPEAGKPGPLPSALEVKERIPPRDFYLALAAAALAFGQGPTARTYAERAVAAAPLDADAQLVLGCVAEYVAYEQVLKGTDLVATPHLRRDAEAAFRKAAAIDPGQVEPRVRLGHWLLADGRHAEAEPVLTEAEALARDERSLYLTRLFLGRAAERLGRPGDAANLYGRALEAWPSAQTARLALAHARETLGDAPAARAQVAATLEASRRDDRPPDPFRAYPFGPAGLAQASLDRLFAAIAP